jgi:hypothetical protein
MTANQWFEVCNARRHAIDAFLRGKSIRVYDTDRCVHATGYLLPQGNGVYTLSREHAILKWDL